MFVGLSDKGKSAAQGSRLPRFCPLYSPDLRRHAREHVRACLGPNFHPLPDIQALFGTVSADGEGPAAAEEAGRTDLAESRPILDGIQAVQALTTLLPWNEQIQAILSADPIVALAQDAASVAANRGGATDDAALRQTCTALVQDTAASSEDSSVRDWRLRSMVLVDGLVGPGTTDQEAAAISEASAVAADALTAQEPIPLDEARAALNQLIVAREHPEVSVSPADLKDILTLPRQTEPVDINLFEQGPRRLAHYAYTLVRRGSLNEAADLFQQIAALYPGSVLSTEWNKDATHLREVGQPRQAAGL